MMRECLISCFSLRILLFRPPAVGDVEWPKLWLHLLHLYLHLGPLLPLVKLPLGPSSLANYLGLG